MAAPFCFHFVAIFKSGRTIYVPSNWISRKFHDWTLTSVGVYSYTENGLSERKYDLLPPLCLRSVSVSVNCVKNPRVMVNTLTLYHALCMSTAIIGILTTRISLNNSTANIAFARHRRHGFWIFHSISFNKLVGNVRVISFCSQTRFSLFSDPIFSPFNVK